MQPRREAVDAYLSKLYEARARNNIINIRRDPVAFRENLIINAADGEVPFGKVMAPFQREDYAAVDNSWRRVCGIPVVLTTAQQVIYRYSYWERGRGHSKTGDIAIQVLWAMLASEGKIRGIVAAGSQEQAGFLREAIDTLLRLNPWLKRYVKAYQNWVRNPHTGSFLKIMATDEGTSMGETPDFAIVDELTHWKNQAFWSAIFSSVPKRPRSFFAVISNAGMEMGDSWQWKAREFFRESPRAYFHSLPGPVAPWITKEDLEDQSKGIPQSAYARLWLNEWQSGTGEGLDHNDIMAAVTLAGPRTDKGHYHGFVISVDLGIKQDHAAVLLGGLDIHTKRLALLAGRRWNPRDYDRTENGRRIDGQVPVVEVERYIRHLQTTFGCDGMIYDPNQCEYMAQNLRTNPPFMVCQPFEYTHVNMNSMAKNLLHGFRSRLIDLYNDPHLLADLRALRIVERVQYHKLEAAKRSDGSHCDMGMALAQLAAFAFDTIHAHAA